ncbi:MAG: ribonuclease HII [Flavobacterium sp.]|nr:ribonuclease HII [Flavobacterium sp.]
MLQNTFSDCNLEAGADEAGRGCLAGPVTAAAVILPTRFVNNILTDSKKLSEKARDLLRPIVEENAVAFSVTHLEPNEIDEINILNASIKGMQECVLKLNPAPQYVIIDGNSAFIQKKWRENKNGKIFTAKEKETLTAIPNLAIVKGDSKYLNIAAASVLAKTYRDEYMNRIHEEYPMYNWKKNKGYPTKEHRAAIAKYGVTKYHRLSFKLLPDQLKLDLEQ